MIPYVVINGVTSKTINGLLISNLPAISKPMIRTNTETIDGRDGDITTTLGYSAYDKTFDIGLHGEYNVDDVIKYFDSCGEVIFSNEPDKYYRFAIYNQIDFSKLLRFKKASVTMHVQPFKYDANEAEKTFATGTFSVRNIGNIYSKPVLTITGTGAVTVTLNNTQILTLALGTGKTIIIDAEQMNAYDTSGNYLNRSVTGNYDDLRLNVGINNIVIGGTITQAKINRISRWI